MIKREAVGGLPFNWSPGVMQLIQLECVFLHLEVTLYKETRAPGDHVAPTEPEKCLRQGSASPRVKVTKFSRCLCKQERPAPCSCGAAYPRPHACRWPWEWKPSPGGRAASSQSSLQNLKLNLRVSGSHGRVLNTRQVTNSRSQQEIKGNNPFAFLRARRTV